MNTATFIRKMDDSWRGDARLYRLDPPIHIGLYSGYKYKGSDYIFTDVEYVIVSAVEDPFPFASGMDTLIFPATENGDVMDWGELDGSVVGTLDHALALRDAGYEIVGEGERNDQRI